MKTTIITTSNNTAIISTIKTAEEMILCDRGYLCCNIKNGSTGIGAREVITSMSDFDREVIRMCLLYAGFVMDETAVVDSGFTSLRKAEYFAELERMSGRNKNILSMLMHGAGFIIDHACLMHAYKNGMESVVASNYGTRVTNKFAIVIEELFFDDYRIKAYYYSKRHFEQ